MLIYESNNKLNINFENEVGTPDIEIGKDAVKLGTTEIGKDSVLPANPTEDGTYTLKVTVSSGVATCSWVKDV